jgi:hypothetical protein
MCNRCSREERRPSTSLVLSPTKGGGVLIVDADSDLIKLDMPTRLSWERTARRGRKLRAEYEARYRVLRRRLCALFPLGAVFALAVVSVSRW